MKITSWLILLLALVKFALPFFLQDPAYEPHRDEFLYLAEGNHLAWGFMEVPPMMSLFAWLTRALGGGMFWVKCWPALFGALTFVLVGKLILSLGGRGFALVLGFLPFICGGYLRLQFLFQPNAFDVFFWTLLSYGIARYIETGLDRYLYIWGITLGLGLLSKYTITFPAIGILAGIALTKARHVFRNRHLYIAAALALLLFLPNLVWQFRQGLPVFFHMHKLQQTQLRYVTPVDFIKSQLLINAPTVFIWIFGLWQVSFSKRFASYRFIGWAYLTVIVLLLLGHGKGYYALGIYPVLFAFGAVGLERVTTVYADKSSRMRAAGLGMARLILVLVPLRIGWYILPLVLPTRPPQALADYYVRTGLYKMGLQKWEDNKIHALPMDFADMLGWEEMAQKAAKAFSLLDSAERSQTLFFCDNYGQAGAMDYYGPKYGLPQAYSDNASFLYWLPEPIYLHNMVLITDDPQDMTYPFIHKFASARLVDSITNPYARERGSLIILLKGASAEMNRLFLEKLQKDKAVFK